MDTGPSALLVKKEKWCIPRSGYYLRPPKTRKSLITNLLSPNFRNRLTSELQRAPHSRTDCDFENLFHREAKRMTKDINVDEEIFTALLENDEPGNVGSLSNKVQLLCASQLRKLCPINLSSLAMQLNQ